MHGQIAVRRYNGNPFLLNSRKFAFKTFDTEYGDAPQLSVLNRGRRYLDLARESLTVASRFNGKSKDMLGKLNNLDSAGSRLSGLLG